MTTAASIISIRLGDRSFDIRPLTIGQLEQLAGISEETGTRLGSASAKAGIASARRVLAVALERIDGEAAKDACAALEATVQELFAAARAILVHSGMVVEAAPSGEAGAGAASA